MTQAPPRCSWREIPPEELPRVRLLGPITDGARALRRYLVELPMAVPAFAELHEIDRLKLQKILNGSQSRVSVDLALAVEEATGGAVPMRLWSSETLSLVSPWESSEGAAPRAASRG